MKNLKRFNTHVKDLFSRCNIKEENIEVYCKNNNVSDKMKVRILEYYNKRK